MTRRLCLSLVAVLVVHGCSCSESIEGLAPGAACDSDTPPSACEQPCAVGTPCPTGLYCDDGVCNADCAVGTECGAGFSCTTAGRCLRDPDRDGGDPTVCADVTLGGRPVTPRVILIVDQSASMTEPFGGSNRWDELRSSLLADDGLIRSLEGTVEFGLALYSAVSDDEGRPVDPDMC